MGLRHRIKRLETRLGLNVPQEPLKTFVDEEGKPYQCPHGKPYPPQPASAKPLVFMVTGRSKPVMIYGLRCECPPGSPLVFPEPLEDLTQPPQGTPEVDVGPTVQKKLTT
jgi:hypothetical protein